MLKQQGGQRHSSASITSSSQQNRHQHQVLPIRMWVRHLSPVESWLFLSVLPTSWFDWYMQMHPRAAATFAGSGGGANNRHQQQRRLSGDELLLVQVAGIVETMPQSSSSSSSYYTGGSSSTPWLTGTEWIQKNLLEKQQTLLTCQLLERQRLPRRRLHPVEENAIEDDEDEEEQEIAVVKVYFRQPNSCQLFSTDLAYYMVRNGIASPALSSCDDATQVETSRSSSSRSSTSVMAADDEKIKQRSQQQQQKQDEAYQEMLQRAEMDAAKESRGMWSDPVVQQQRRDVMDEVEFQTTASTQQKLWRWIQQTWRQRQQRQQQKVNEEKSKKLS
jgi:hypothetical protein